MVLLLTPPPAWFKDNIARGLVPENWAVTYREKAEHRCFCGHMRSIHFEGTGTCQAKACTKFPPGCFAFRQNPLFLIPEWKSKGLADVTVTLDKKAPST